MWGRTANVGMDKEGYSKGAAHDSGENPQRMVAAPTILPLASTTSASGTLGSIPICDVPTKPATGSDVTYLLHGAESFLSSYLVCS